MGLYLTDLPEERIAKYRRKAADARESAYNAQTIENSNAYMELAAAWEAMAVDLEHSEQATRKRLRVRWASEIGRKMPSSTRNEPVATPKASRAYQRGIGRELRLRYDKIAREPVPNELLELLHRIDAAGRLTAKS
jgi:hypothetical protein